MEVIEETWSEHSDEESKERDQGTGVQDYNKRVFWDVNPQECSTAEGKQPAERKTGRLKKRGKEQMKLQSQAGTGLKGPQVAQW